MLRIATLLGLTLALTACGTIQKSWVNPVNWFGSSEPKVVQPIELALAAADGRVLIPEITDLVIEPTTAGAILRAKGLPATNGWWDGELVKRRGTAREENIYDFVVEAPFEAEASGMPRTRAITTATHISAQELRRLRKITVISASGARVISR